MGCSYETVKQTVRINKISNAAITKDIKNNCTNINGNKFLSKNNNNNNHNNINNKNKHLKTTQPTKNHNSNDCQVVQIQQQQTKPAITNIAVKANKTSIATFNKIYNNTKDSTSGNCPKEVTTEINSSNLEALNHTNWSTNPSGRQATVSSKKTLQSCINCYPLACQNRFCCEKQKCLVRTGEIANQTRQTLKPSNYIEANNCSHNSSSHKNNCCCHLSFSHPEHTENTLRHDEESEGQLYSCNCNAAQTNGFVACLNGPSTNRECLQETLVQARTSLIANALDLKNNLMEMMTNCANVAKSMAAINTLVLKNCLCDGIVSNSKRSNNNIDTNTNTNTNNNNNNDSHIKSEPYRGYYQQQRQHHLSNKNNYSSYSSSRTLNISSTNSCSLHNAISSNRRCKNNNHMPHTAGDTAVKCNSHKAQNTGIGKRLNKSYHNSHNCQASSSAHTAAAFNYIGQNYYSFLRNTINFYTASSVILVLCYLTSTTSAATTKSDSTSIDKHPIFDESSSDKEILDLLLEKKRYDKRLLPPVNDEDFCCGLSSPDMATEINSRRPHKRGTLTVNVNVLLLSLASPDESSLKYEVEFLLNQQWNDPRLQYGNKSHYDFLNALHHHDSIWTPDTYFIMHGDFKDPIIPMHFALRIYRNGTITYAMRRHLILSCQGSLHIFPFDDPKCSFSMESISYEEAQIKYIWKNDEDTLRKSPSLTTLNAYLIKNQTTACDQNSWRGNYSCLRVDLIFTRDRAFYFTTVFIPGIILVTSSFITFWLEWNAVPARSMIGNYSCLHVELTFTRDRAYYFTTVFIPGIILVTSSFITFWLEWNAVPARVMIGVTTMLNFFTTSNGFRSTLPVVSNLTAMNVWDGVCMCFIYASLLEFVCVNYMGRKRPQHNVVYRPGENPVTQRLPAVLSRIGVILASPLEIIEREFHAALSSEKAAAGLSSGGTSMRVTPTPATPKSEPLSRVHFYQEPTSGGIIATAVQNLRSRSLKRRSTVSKPDEIMASREMSSHVYEHVYTEPGGVTTCSAVPSLTTTTTVTIEHDANDEITEPPKLRRTQSMSTNTPPLICKSELQTDIKCEAKAEAEPKQIDVEQIQMPIKPPRKKSSRSTSPSTNYDALQREMPEIVEISAAGNTGEKKRDAGGPNEIVACTTCGGSSGSPCTHSANNGCATETCFVQVRKKEPPHPIRIAKTIDVIARITFPTAYAIFLIFFFVHYKGFS